MADRPPIPTLQTERLILRPFSLEDAPEVQRLAGDAKVAATTLVIPHPYPDGLAEQWIASHAQGPSLTLAMEERQSSDFLGAIGLEPKNQQHRMELGYWMRVDRWGEGFTTEAANALLDWTFSLDWIDRIEAYCMTSNPGSERVMEKAGMVKEGTLRNYMSKNGTLHDVVTYAVLRSDRRLNTSKATENKPL